jgi:hypothetical protein
MPASRGGRRATSRAAASTPRIPKARSQFTRLLAANPNYFGTMPEAGEAAVSAQTGNTTYEEVTCVAYSPQLRLLEATVQLKLPGGYAGALCDPGSTEYVRFYLDYGAGWTDAGVAGFNSHDLPATTDCAGDATKPLSYVVTLEIDPQKAACFKAVLPAVRAILSWNLEPPPGAPGWTPPWGNAIDDHVQIKPRPWLWGDLVSPLVDIVDKIELPPLVEEVYPIPIPLPDPPPLDLAQAIELYAGAGDAAAKAPRARKAEGAVEAHRFATTALSAAMGQAGGGVEASGLLSLAETFKAYDLDLSAIIDAFEDTKSNVGYEELECVGLDTDLERLVATFRVKRPVGYSGGLCTAGSLEHIAFWADWDDDCAWTYLGTATVNVHDIASIPPEGLAYAAVLPIDLKAIRRPCEEPRIARVRAVLSWSILPSTTDPDALTTWGNRLDTHVQVKPGDPIGAPQAIITAIGGIGLPYIDTGGDGMTWPFVHFASFGTQWADPWGTHGRKCPFGGLVMIQGPSFASGGFKYRLWARNTVTSELVLVKSKFWVLNFLGFGSWQTPDPVTGYSPYLPVLANMENVLAYWNPPGDDLWEVRLEMATAAEVVVDSTPWYRIQLDNAGPVRKPKGEAPIATDTLDISIETGGGDCADFTVGDVIGGRLVARDPYFGAYSLSTLPSSLGPTNPTTDPPVSNLVQTPPALPLPGGHGWKLDTAGMDPCGYVVMLRVWDRAIVGSQPGSHNENFTDVGFCLRGP